MHVYLLEMVLRCQLLQLLPDMAVGTARRVMLSTTKELLAMPCMQTKLQEQADSAAAGSQHVATQIELQAFHRWTSQPHNLKLEVLHLQQEDLEMNQDEDVIEEAQPSTHGLLELPHGLPPLSRFVDRSQSCHLHHRKSLQAWARPNSAGMLLPLAFAWQPNSGWRPHSNRCRCMSVWQIRMLLTRPRCKS